MTAYKLVVVPEETEVPGAAASVSLPDGTTEIVSVVHWCVYSSGGRFEGGSTTLRFDLRRLP